MDMQNIRYYSLEKLNQRLATLSFRLPAVILSQAGADRWGLGQMLAERQAMGNLVWIKEVDPNPTQETIYRVRRALRGCPIDGLVSIGGGSAIDLAKAVGAFHTMPDLDTPDLTLETVRNKEYLNNGKNALPIIAVPTTAGTGSEATQWATVWDARSCSKYSIDAPWLKPQEAWIVPELTCSLPPRLTLATGLDAVCHAAEAYWSKASSPLSKAVAIRSLQLLTGNLSPALADPCNIVLRENLCTGSLLAGLAFSTTRTTACHSISYPLTALFGVEHGLAAAMTLGQVAEINGAAVDLAELTEVFAPYGGIQPWMDSVCAGTLTLRLSSFGIEESDLDRIVKNAFASGRIDNNSVDLDATSIKHILRKVMQL